MKTFIIPTSQAEHLGRSILTKTKPSTRANEVIFSDLNKDGKRYFPDEEVYMRISKINTLREQRVIVLHSGSPKPNEGLIELELILQILRDNDIKPEVFFSYFPYGIQDKVFEKGETNVAENLIGKFTNYYKVKKIYTIDAHFLGRKWCKKYPIINISAAPILIEKSKKDLGEDVLILSPDFGERRRTKILGMKKERINSYRVKMVSPKINFKEKIIGVIDDVIKTGGTLLKFQEIAKKAGAKKIIALITHGVLSKGIERVKAKYSKLYLTNTIKQKDSNIDITNLILKTISKI